MNDKLNKVNMTLKDEMLLEMSEKLDHILENITLADMITANNVSISLNQVRKEFLGMFSSLRLACALFAQGLNAFTHLIENNKNIGFTKMDSIIKLNGYKYFSSTQYDKRYLNNPYFAL